MVASGALVAIRGSRSVVRLSLLLFALPPAFIGLTTRSLLQLFAVLLVWGAGIGSLDVALNSQAVDVQDAYERPVMSSFHAMFSIGALVGGGLGALAAARHLSVTTHLAVFGGVVLVVGEWATTRMLVPSNQHRESRRRFVRPDRQLVLLAALGFGVLLCEGVASDWSAVYLREVLGASAGIAGLGYVAFSVAMIFGRLVGDRLTVVFGGGRMLRISCLIAAVALALVWRSGRSGRSSPDSPFWESASHAGLRSSSARRDGTRTRDRRWPR